MLREPLTEHWTFTTAMPLEPSVPVLMLTWAGAEVSEVGVGAGVSEIVPPGTTIGLLTPLQTAGEGDKHSMLTDGCIEAR